MSVLRSREWTQRESLSVFKGVGREGRRESTVSQCSEEWGVDTKGEYVSVEQSREWTQWENMSVIRSKESPQRRKCHC